MPLGGQPGAPQMQVQAAPRQHLPRLRGPEDPTKASRRMHDKRKATEPIYKATSLAVLVIHNSPVLFQDKVSKVRKGTLQSGAREAEAAALNNIKVAEAETWKAASRRLVLVYRVYLADPVRIRILEATYVWTYINEEQLDDLLERLAQRSLLRVIDHVGLQGVAHHRVWRIAVEVRPLLVDYANPTGLMITMGGVKTEVCFGGMVDLISTTKKVCWQPARFSLKGNHSPFSRLAIIGDDAMARVRQRFHYVRHDIAGLLGKTSGRAAGVESLAAMGDGRDTGDQLDQVSLAGVFYDPHTYLGYDIAEQPKLGADSSYQTVVAFTAQAASTSGRHRVPFEKRGQTAGPPVPQAASQGSSQGTRLVASSVAGDHGVGSVAKNAQDKTRDILVRVVRDLTYAFILRASYFRASRSVISLGVGKGFHPSPGSPWDIYYDVQPAADNPPPLVHLPQSVQQLPVCSVGQAAWDDDGTLRWELGLPQPVDLAGSVAVAVEGCVHGPQLSERKLVLIQPATKCDIDSAAVVGMARGVQWWESATPLYCEVVNTGRAAALVRSGHPIAKVTVLNVRDGDVFRAMFVHPPAPPANPFPAPTDDPPPVREAGTSKTLVRGVELSDANLDQLSVGQQNQLSRVLQPHKVRGLF